MLTELQVEEIRTRCEAATPGPWTYEDDHEGSSMGWISGKRSRNQYESELFHVLGDGAEEYETAEFVAHSRTDIPALLADRDEMQKLLREAVRQLNRTECAGCDEEGNCDDPLCEEIDAFLSSPAVQELVK